MMIGLATYRVQSAFAKAIAYRFYLNIQDHFQAAMFSLALPTAFLAETHENES